MEFFIYGSLIIVIPGLIFAAWAQFRVNSTFAKYSKVETSAKWTAEQVGSKLLSQNGCTSVMIGRTPGHLTDNFNPQSGVLALSDSTYGKSSVAAVGVAAHECGHAMQQHDGSNLLLARSALVPLTRYGSMLAVPIAIIGVILELIIGGAGTNFGTYVISLGVLLYSLSTIFALITLPVEIDASRRAVLMLRDTALYTREELASIKKVLYAAALTYVASLVVSFLYLVRFIVILNRFRKDD